MQRLFSTFAEGPPGVGLLIQRLVFGAALVYCALAAPSGAFLAVRVVAALSGLLILAGLWTPVAGVVAASAEAWLVFSPSAQVCNPAVLAVLAVTLALIGPGAWSIDARLYGRKRYAPPPL